MFTYNPETKILKVQKIPEPDFELNLLEYQLESYHRYLSDTIYSDFEYLLEVMREKLQVSQVDAKITSIDLVCRDYQAEIRKQKPRYYSVKAKFTIDNVT